MGIGFLVKGFMIFLPILAITPFIVWARRMSAFFEIVFGGLLVGFQ